MEQKYYDNLIKRIDEVLTTKELSHDIEVSFYQCRDMLCYDIIDYDYKKYVARLVENELAKMNSIPNKMMVSNSRLR